MGKIVTNTMVQEKKEMLFIVYDDINHDERVLETLRIFSTKWDITVVSFTENVPFCKKNIVTGNGKINYFSFFTIAQRMIKRFSGDIIYLHDNYCSTLIKYAKRRKLKIIYDSSELYFDKVSHNKKNWIKNLLFNTPEEKYLKLCDVVVAANKERAVIMKDRFELNMLPVIFDNVHKITDTYNVEECEQKFGKFFREKKKVICYFGGIQKKRGTFELINDVLKLGDDYTLLIGGKADKNDIDLFLN